MLRRELIDLQSAQDLAGAIWGHEMAQALTGLEGKVSQLEEAGQKTIENTFSLGAFRRIKGAMQDVWKDVQVDVFSVRFVAPTSFYTF